MQRIGHRDIKEIALAILTLISSRYLSKKSKSNSCPVTGEFSYISISQPLNLKIVIDNERKLNKCANTN
ncbi:MAG: hypothetical protein WBQ25_20980, partial [Nitrososphaeraceae archaeon]